MGVIREVGDGVAKVEGLSDAMLNEMLDLGHGVTGLVTINRIRQVPPDERDRTRLADIACPLADVATAGPDDSVADLLPRLTACADRRALVFRDGRLAGIV